jgi:hypothetical protein
MLAAAALIAPRFGLDAELQASRDAARLLY